nr:hypothetical protein [Thermoproteota archaeon]
RRFYTPSIVGNDKIGTDPIKLNQTNLIITTTFQETITNLVKFSSRAIKGSHIERAFLDNPVN